MPLVRRLGVVVMTGWWSDRVGVVRQGGASSAPGSAPASSRSAQRPRAPQYRRLKVHPLLAVTLCVRGLFVFEHISSALFDGKDVIDYEATGMWPAEVVVDALSAQSTRRLVAGDSSAVAAAEIFTSAFGHGGTSFQRCSSSASSMGAAPRER